MSKIKYTSVILMFASQFLFLYSPKLLADLQIGHCSNTQNNPTAGQTAAPELAVGEECGNIENCRSLTPGISCVADSGSCTFGGPENINGRSTRSVQVGTCHSTEVSGAECRHCVTGSHVWMICAEVSSWKAYSLGMCSDLCDTGYLADDAGFKCKP